MRKRTTIQLLNMIKKGHDISVLEECEQDIDNPTLEAFLKDQMEKKDIKVSKLAEEVFLDRSFVYQIMNGTRSPNRIHLLRIAFVLHLTVDETQCMLRLARKGELYPRVRFDAAIIFALQKKLTLEEVDETLKALGEPTLL